MIETTWHELDTGDPTELRAFVEASEALVNEYPEKALEHDVSWFESLGALNGNEARMLRLFVLRKAQTLDGFANFLVHPTSLRYGLGDRTLFSLRTRRWALAGNPVLSARLSDSERIDMTAELMRLLRKTMEPDDVVFLGGVPVGGPLDSLLCRDAAVWKDFHVLPHGPVFKRWRVEFPETFERYFGSLGRRTREGLRRQKRKLLRHVDNAVELRCYTSPDSVEDFLDMAEPVSRKSWQWKTLGLGLRDTKQLRTQFRSMARLGRWRSYLLLCRDAPVAFLVGYVYRRTFFYYEVGFDPRWAPWSVGSILNLYLLEDLMARNADIDELDFLYGDNEYKERFGSSSQLQRHYYLMPRTGRGWFLAHGLRFVNGLSSVAGRTLQRWGLKARVQRFLRRSG